MIILLDGTIDCKFDNLLLQKQNIFNQIGLDIIVF